MVDEVEYYNPKEGKRVKIPLYLVDKSKPTDQLDKVYKGDKSKYSGKTIVITEELRVPDLSPRRPRVHGNRAWYIVMNEQEDGTYLYRITYEEYRKKGGQYNHLQRDEEKGFVYLEDSNSSDNQNDRDSMQLQQIKEEMNEFNWRWIPIYEEMADKLLQYKENREDLVKAFYDMFDKDELRNSKIERPMDENPENTKKELEDICPFTFLSFLNRKLKPENRNFILNYYANFLGMKSNHQDFKFINETTEEAIPLVHPQKSWFFGYEYKRGKDIDTLWRMFEIAIKNADTNGGYEQEFIKSYKETLDVKSVKERKLSIGLYWIRPNYYPSMDSKSKKYYASLTHEGHIRDDFIKDFKYGKYNGEKYIKFAEHLRQAFAKEYHNNLFVKLSYKAYNPKPTLPLPPNNNYRTKEYINQILYGPPGTGKTYRTKKLAVEIVKGWNFKDDEKDREEINKLYKEEIDKGKDKRIEFVTFHQSYGYEEFVEGIKPDMDEKSEDSKSSEIKYQIKNGVFKDICNRAKDDPDNNYVLIVDEINRGNISKILGELITLLEKDKRLGEDEHLQVTLPYSPEAFSVPNNLFIIGTMNTADRSIAFLDSALRRRFEFTEIMPDYELLKNVVEYKDVDISRMLEKINERIRQHLDRDHQIGHSYFMEVETLGDLAGVFRNSICPLLDEYFYDRRQVILQILSQNNDPNKCLFIKKSDSNDPNDNKNWEWDLRNFDSPDNPFQKSVNYKNIYDISVDDSKD